MEKPKEIFLKDYKKPDFSIKSVDLVFDIFEDYTIVTNTMEFNKTNLSQQDLILDSLELELIEIWLGNLKLHSSRYHYDGTHLTIYNVPQTFQIKIINKIYPYLNTELEGLYKSGDIFCTQNEPEGFRKITPYLDRPDVMSVFTTTVIADKKKYPILLSNGNKYKEEEKGKRHSVTWIDPFVKPSYLFALVAGDLGVLEDKFVTKSGKEIDLHIYCDLGNESKCSYAMQSLKDAMLWDEKVYKREYDLEIYNIVAVDSFNMGAMENKGLNIFNSHYVLADKEHATDKDFMGIQSVIAHEYFHNWTGNRITCQSWFELTLKEGLTVFRDQQFSADMNSKEVARINDVKMLRQRQFVEDASPTAHPIQPKSYISMNNFYTATVYEKGAEVIRMLFTLLGKEGFYKGMDYYFEAYDGKAVTIHDFLYAMSHTNKKDLSIFERWYHQSGTPTLIVEEQFAQDKLTLKFTQKIPKSVDNKEQKHYHFPLKIGLLEQNGSEIIEKVLEINEVEQEFTFENLSSQPIVSLNRDFSAPIIIKQLQKPNYPFLMQYDTNSFTKYEAAQNFALEVLQNMMKGKEIDPLYLQTFGSLLEFQGDLSYKALLLELPSISAIMQTQESIDFDVIYEASDKLHTTLAIMYKEKLLEIYHSFEPDSIGKRALRNRVLKLLSYVESEDIITLAKIQYQKAQTMTDRINALAIIEGSSFDAKEFLEDFYHRYHKDTLVMNKYFALLASSEKEGVLQRVKLLQQDPAYDMQVPNLVRALLGSFTQNFRYFHAKDGLGYRFIADKIIEIDAINPQMASSLAGAFKLYNKLNQTNKKQIEEVLKCVKSTHSISNNLLEIIDKILFK